MTDNPNKMSIWPEIKCQRGHEAHAAKIVDVALGGPTGYQDYSPIPERFKRQYRMHVWDTSVHPIDGGPYCPAADAVSETIISHKIWEPRETSIALHICSTGPEGEVIDIGAQCGWYSLLAASCGREVMAIEADPDNADLLYKSAELNGWETQISIVRERITSESKPLSPIPHIRFVKIDIEGAEKDAIRTLWPAIKAGHVDFILMEISPVFESYYPALVKKIIGAGYSAYWLPPSSSPPISLDQTANVMERFRADKEEGLYSRIASLHQEDMLFKREGAIW